jgi:hypothetical protein
LTATAASVPVPHTMTGSARVSGWIFNQSTPATAGQQLDV